jgi:hypothetical protein
MLVVFMLRFLRMMVFLVFYVVSSLYSDLADRRSDPRIGVPVLAQGARCAVAVLSELPGEYIGSGLICTPFAPDQSVLDVCVVYRVHDLDSLLLTFCVDFSQQRDFALLVLFRFSSTLRV